jgi:hypothetical protein
VSTCSSCWRASGSPPPQAAEALGLTPRQVRRLRGRLRREVPGGLVHGNRGRPAPNRLPASLRGQIAAPARGRYAGLNDYHLTEKLTALEGLAVSRATVQHILRAAGAGGRSLDPRRPRLEARAVAAPRWLGADPAADFPLSPIVGGGARRLPTG